MTKKKECEKCGDEYESYLILYKKDFFTAISRSGVREEYSDLCRDCFNDEMWAHEYAITDR